MRPGTLVHYAQTARLSKGTSGGGPAALISARSATHATLSITRLRARRQVDGMPAGVQLKWIGCQRVLGSRG